MKTDLSNIVIVDKSYFFTGAKILQQNKHFLL